MSHAQAMDVHQRIALRPKQPLVAFEVQEQIIGEHEGVLFMNKPAGWPTSGRSLQDEECLQHRLMNEAGRMVWAVHQLDGDTSGLNVFTRRKDLVPIWQKRLHFPQARKEYLAIVHGRVDQPMRLEALIGRREDGSWGVSKTGKSALTLVTPVAVSDAYSLLRIHLRTGRTHQIRVHMSHAGFPLVGEFWYNDAPCLVAPRQMLHAWRTRFDRQQDPGCVVAAVPEDMLRVAERLGVTIPTQVDGNQTRLSAVYPHEPR